jgi:carbon monoxide dehydrogenase subunit G
VIEAQHSLVIEAGIEPVWDYVQDISRWAELFPGCRECEIIDEHNSRWVIKVGTGGMIKTVNVRVKVDQWDGPGRVDFSYRLEAESVVGGGSYTAARKSDVETEVALMMRVEGSGQMAAMWEAMCKPLLPQMARTFSGKLKAEIEALAPGAASAPVAKLSLGERLGNWLRKLWRTLPGSPAESFLGGGRRPEAEQGNGAGAHQNRGQQQERAVTPEVVVDRAGAQGAKGGAER